MFLLSWIVPLCCVQLKTIVNKNKINSFCQPSWPWAVVAQSPAPFVFGHTLSVELGFEGMGLSVSSRSYTSMVVGVLGAQAKGKNEVCRKPKRKDAREGRMIKREMKNKVFRENRKQKWARVCRFERRRCEAFIPSRLAKMIFLSSRASNVAFLISTAATICCLSSLQH